MKNITQRQLTLPTLVAASLLSLTAAAGGPQYQDLDGERGGPRGGKVGERSS